MGWVADAVLLDVDELVGCARCPVNKMSPAHRLRHSRRRRTTLSSTTIVASCPPLSTPLPRRRLQSPARLHVPRRTTDRPPLQVCTLRIKLPLKTLACTLLTQLQSLHRQMVQHARLPPQRAPQEVRWCSIASSTLHTPQGLHLPVSHLPPSTKETGTP